MWHRTTSGNAFLLTRGIVELGCFTTGEGSSDFHTTRSSADLFNNHLMNDPPDLKIFLRVVILESLISNDTHQNKQLKPH